MQFPYILPLLLVANTSMADLPDIIDDFRFASVIALGEIHDNPQHHILQAEITAAIQPSALVFEMFSSEQAETINSFRSEGEGMDALSDVFEWHKTGWPPFEQYSQIIQSNPEGVVFGAAVPINDVRDAIFEGAAAIFGVDARVYGLDLSLSPEEQTARESNQFEAHCGALPEEQLAGMVEAQRLRDAVLADTVIRALEQVGGPVIVITGNGHAREDWGFTAVLKSFAPDIVIMTLGQFESEPEEPQPFTHILVSEPVDREDPCLYFLD